MTDALITLFWAFACYAFPLAFGARFVATGLVLWPVGCWLLLGGRFDLLIILK